MYCRIIVAEVIRKIQRNFLAESHIFQWHDFWPAIQLRIVFEQVSNNWKPGRNHFSYFIEGITLPDIRELH